MDMIGRIRRLSRRGKKSEREISRMAGLSRNTVSKTGKPALDRLIVTFGKKSHAFAITDDEEAVRLGVETVRCPVAGIENTLDQFIRDRIGLRRRIGRVVRMISNTS